MTNQEQKGGMGSTNVQIANLTTGMTYRDVSDIARDVFVNNMRVYAAKAKDEADARAQELREELIEKLKLKNIDELSGFDQPEKQSALFEAQKAYALSGDGELKSSLVNMVIDLSASEERSIKSIVLQEAIKIAPVLTPRQMKILAVSFLMRYVNLMPTVLPALEIKLHRFLRSDYIAGQITPGDLRHIEYTRCGTVELGEISFGEVLRRSYPGIISAGYTPEEIAQKFAECGVPNIGFTQAPLDDAKIVILASNDVDLRSNQQAFGWSEAQLNVALNMLEDKSKLLDDNALTNGFYEKAGPTVAAIAQDWEAAPLKNLKLSSVGLTLGHAYTMGAVGDPVDVSIWL